MTQKSTEPQRTLIGNRQSVKGQIAVIFLVLMAFILILVKAVINVGQVAQVKAETSNAADAGALTAASWLASGQNEAAWVARKMQDAKTMIEALYLIPFAPDAPGETAHRDYAWALWESLVGPGPCEPGHYAGCGPNSYLHHVADGAMYSAWAISHREFATAAINNMIIRFATGTRFNDCAPGGLGDPACKDNFGDISLRILNFQRSMYEDPISARGNVLPFTWNNSAPIDDPDRVDHQANFRVEYSALDPPALIPKSDATTYYQYGQDPVEPCDVPLLAITNTGGPFAGLPSPLPVHPLAVDDTGFKYWDFDLERLIPSIDVLQIALVDACGISGPGPLQTASLPVVAQEDIANSPGTVWTQVGHQVKMPDETIKLADGRIIPLSWKKRFPYVESESKARFTETTLPQDAWTQPLRDASAQLVETPL